jgi:3-hydroxyisobutyrate dehydrogenase-like beta-hydroxyacid dehydrogenase
MADLGYVGLGTMGGRMAKRLLDAGHSVVGYNRTKSKAEWLIEAGLAWADTPRQVAERSDVVLSMVTGTAAVVSITDGPDGILAGLGPGKIYIDMSTAGASNSRAVAEKVRACGAEMLDAPVSGSVSTLQEGKLSIMVGGDRATYEKALPILLDIGPKVMHVGANGLAVAMKIATNLSLGVQMLAFCEGTAGGEKRDPAREGG